MPDQDDKVLFSAEFDSKTLKAGTDEAIKGFEALKNQQIELNEEMAQTQEKLDANNKAFKENEAVIASLNKKSADYSTTLATLQKKSAVFAESSNKLSLSLNNQKKSYDEITSKLTGFNSSVKGAQDVYASFVEKIGEQLSFHPEQLKVFADGLREGIAGELAGIDLSGIDLSGLGELGTKLQGTETEFEALNTLVDAARQKLQTLAPNTEEFDNLNNVVKAGEQLIEGYSAALKEVGNGTKPIDNVANSFEKNTQKSSSFRKELQALKIQLKELEDQGKDDTEQYRKLELAAAKLTDRLGDQQSRIKILASDTKNLDFGLGVIQAAAAGLQTYTGLIEAFGLSSEDAAEANRKLLAILNLVSGAQQLQNLLLKESVIRTVGANIVTKAYAATQVVLAAATGASAAATKALSVALLATGVGALVVALGFLIPKIIDWVQGLRKAGEAERAIMDAINEGAKGAAAEVTKLEILRLKINDTTQSQKFRLDALKEYNKEADKANQISTKEIENLDLVNTRISAQIELIERRSLARAAEAALAKDADKLIAQRLEVARLAKSVGDQPIVEEKVPIDVARNLNAQQLTALVAGAQQANKGVQLLAEAKARLAKDEEEFQFKLKNLAPLLNVDFATDKDGNKIENVFADKLREFLAKLRAASESEFQSEDIIREKFNKKLDDEIADVNKLIKEKKLTVQQGGVLASLLGNINDVETAKEIDKFRDKVRETGQTIQSELTNLSLAASQKRIENIQDDFERERATIDQEFLVTQRSLVKQREDLIKQVNAAEKLGLISPATAIIGRNQIREQFNSFIDELVAATEIKRQALAFKSFQAATAEIEAANEKLLLGISDAANVEIKKYAEAYKNGTLTYTQYQKKLTGILREESNERRRLTIEELQAQLLLINAQLKTQKDPDVKKGLEKQRTDILKNISQLTRDTTSAATAEQKETQDKNLQQLQAWVGAVGSAIGSIAGFWQQVNQQEQASLDRSIAIQEKRVERAKELADAGNAQFLDLEQKRLDELNRKRAEAARKQLIIDNAVRLSQATLAAISAVAYAAEQGGAIAAVAAGVAIVGVLASAYQFASSLQQPTAEGLFRGKEYVNDTRAPMGKDTVKANLNIGERVVTAQDNKDYWKTLTAIHNHKVPAGALNAFVGRYPDIPLTNYGRVEDVVDAKYQSDANVKGEIEKTNEKLDALNHGLSKLGVKINIDKDGLALSVHESIQQLSLNRRS